MKTLDLTAVKEQSIFTGIDHVQRLQISVYTMCGGGVLGLMAAEQPADFYLDDRLARLPYPKRAINQAVKVLEIHAVKEGLDPHRLPVVPVFHNCGIL